MSVEAVNRQRGSERSLWKGKHTSNANSRLGTTKGSVQLSNIIKNSLRWNNFTNA